MLGPASRIGYNPGQDVTLDHLQDQIEWYDRNSGWNRKAFRAFKLVTLITGALIPAVAHIRELVWLTTALGLIVVITEGLQQLYQYHANWISYRATCEALKHEKFLFLARGGSYSTAADANALLAERIVSLISQENSKWTSSQEQSAKKEGKGDQPV